MHDEQIAAVLDSASTWAGVQWVETPDAGQALTIADDEFGRAADRTVAAAFPDRLAAAVVRHGWADRRDPPGWTETTVAAEGDVRRAVELLRLSHLNHVAQIRQWRPEAFPSVDLSVALDEIRPSPGVRYLVQEP